MGQQGRKPTCESRASGKGKATEPVMTGVPGGGEQRDAQGAKLFCGMRQLAFVKTHSPDDTEGTHGLHS